MDWNNQRILIVGAARQGTALAKYFVNQGAVVTITDLRSREELLEYADTLKEYPVNWVLGEHPTSLLDGVDLVCVSGGVPLTAPIIVDALNRGIPLSNDSQIFLEVAPCKVIGITGSAGKTTTTSLVGCMADFEAKKENGNYRKAWVGGNIGNPLISSVDEMQGDDIAIMELSSFQLEIMSLSPQIAAVLNITPNHLDRHKTMEAYVHAKTRIIEYQTNCDVAVLNRDDKLSWGLKDLTQGLVFTFGLEKPINSYPGSYIENDGIFLRDGEEIFKICERSEIKLLGTHNLMNVLAAVSIAYAANISLESIREGIMDFKGVEHRLEFVRTWEGADWYNDSIATAPERAMAAIRSFDRPIVLLAGGRDKDLPWEDFARLVGERVRYLILFGEAAEKINNAVKPHLDSSRIKRCERMEEAVEEASRIVQPGDVVLLSPGGTSFDEFQDFAERGVVFRKLVNELP